MNILPIEIPKPSKFVKHTIVDEIANEVNKIYRVQMNHSAGYIVDVEKFIDVYLKMNIIWEEIDEPTNRVCFAKLSYDESEYTITLNENHRLLFESKSELLRSCLSHEIGHYALKHFEHLFSNSSQGNLFGNEENSPNYLHDSSWQQLGVTYEVIAELKNKLAKTALLNEKDRKLISTLEDRLELKWMYLQAEQFSSCFLIPKAKLFDFLNDGLDLTNWQSLYSLRDIFGVSISMMVVRLEKLELIKVCGKQIQLFKTLKQSNFWA